jgi:hypothetical protein
MQRGFVFVFILSSSEESGNDCTGTDSGSSFVEHVL